MTRFELAEDQRECSDTISRFDPSLIHEDEDEQKRSESEKDDELNLYLIHINVTLQLTYSSIYIEPVCTSKPGIKIINIKPVLYQLS